jgi:hypothetical protein
MMSLLDLGLGFALLTVVAFSAVIISTLHAGKKNGQKAIQQLTADLSGRDASIQDLRKQIADRTEEVSDFKAKLAVCSSNTDRLQVDLNNAEQRIVELKGNLSRYATIDDAEMHASNVTRAAEARVQDLDKKATKIKSDAIVMREQALRLKEQRDSLNGQVKGLQVFLDGCNSIQKVQTQIEQSKSDHAAALIAMESQNRERANELASQLNAIQSEIESRKKELDLIDEEAEMQSFGIFRSRFDYDHSDKYREAMKQCVKDQKAMVKEKEACVCATTWTVEGSEAKGRTMINRNIKLMLRAVSGECDAIIAKVNHNNVEASEKRIQKCFEVIGKLGDTNQISFSPRYMQLKLQELFLNYEHAAAKQEEKEREREIREAMREEEKAAKEIAKAQESAEKEEASKEAALKKARQQLAAEHGAHNAKLQELVEKLENELSEAIDRKAKAIARAQLTRSGHVYILSNIGTMGEGVFKIGMTRRLEPLDRVKELGDASVPFPFDVHAMIYSEDAPALENALHKHFGDRRVNLVNLRREYFHVTLDEIRDAVAEHYGLVTFRLIPEAEQYRDTKAMREEARLASA